MIGSRVTLPININIVWQDHCTVRQTNAKIILSGSLTTSLLFYAKCELHYFCWFVFAWGQQKCCTSKNAKWTTFAGSFWSNQQKCCTSKNANWTTFAGSFWSNQQKYCTHIAFSCTKLKLHAIDEGVDPTDRNVPSIRHATESMPSQTFPDTRTTHAWRLFSTNTDRAENHWA